MHRRRRLFGLSIIALAMIGVPATAQGATPTDTTALQDAVIVGGANSGIRQHLRQLQVIADANGGTRATGTPGHIASATYVENTLAPFSAYWTVSEQSFSADIFHENASPTLAAHPAATPAWVAQEMNTCRSRVYAARVFVEAVVASHAASSASRDTVVRRGAAMARFCQMCGLTLNIKTIIMLSVRVEPFHPGGTTPC